MLAFVPPFSGHLCFFLLFVCQHLPETSLLYSLSICYGSFVIIWYDGEAVAFVQNIFRFLKAQVCEWTTHHAEPSFSA